MQVTDNHSVVLAQLTLRTLMKEVADLIGMKEACRRNAAAQTETIDSLKKKLAETENPPERALKIITTVMETMRSDRARVREDSVRFEESIKVVTDEIATISELLTAEEVLELVEAEANAAKHVEAFKSAFKGITNETPN